MSDQIVAWLQPVVRKVVTYSERKCIVKVFASVLSKLNQAVAFSESGYYKLSKTAIRKVLCYLW